MITSSTINQNFFGLPCATSGNSALPAREVLFGGRWGTRTSDLTRVKRAL